MKTDKIAVVFTVGERRTRVELEEEFWEALQDIAARQNTELATLVEQLNRRRGATHVRNFLLPFGSRSSRSRCRCSSRNLNPCART
jgi:hypothetical protein